MDLDLIPEPRRIRRHEGAVRIAKPGLRATSIVGFDPSYVQDLLRRLHAAEKRPSRPAEKGTGGEPVGGLSVRRASGRRLQWYNLRVRPTGVEVLAGDVDGLRFAIITLGQLLAVRPGLLPIVDIEDWPDFPVRGVMLDISRDKVPTMATLRGLVDLLAGWKINQLQLYMEHTFAYPSHPDAWRGASPLTPKQIASLQQYCLLRGIELVPNQNTFGHMERWLAHPRYAPLANADGPWTTPWGETRTRRTMLNPLDPGSIRLVRSILDELLPHFSSDLVHVGCDETFELGQGRCAAACRKRGAGRVYLDFVKKIYLHLQRRERRMMFWSDIVHSHPALIGELPDDVIPTVWGYEADHPFAKQCATLAKRGLKFYVCPGTSSWCSFAGRTTNCLANLRGAAQAGRRYGATGYLITDWGDYGHRQYLPVSYLGFLYGASVSWCLSTNADIDAAAAVGRHVFGDPTGEAGRLWADAGDVHTLSGVFMRNKTVLFEAMQRPWEEATKLIEPQAAARMEQRLAELEARSRKARFDGVEGDVAQREWATTLAILRHACRRCGATPAPALSRRGRGSKASGGRRGLLREIREIMEQHRSLWLARNRRGGLADSLAHYRRVATEYAADTQV